MLLKKIIGYFDLGLLPYRPKLGKAGFKLTQASFMNLENENVPEPILESLRVVQDQQFTTEDKFLHFVGQQIGKQKTDDFRSLILEHAENLEDEQEKKRKRQKALWHLLYYMCAFLGVFSSYLINPLKRSDINISSLNISNVIYALVTTTLIFPWIYKFAKFNVDSPNVMQMFIAFQCGFFWETILHNVVQGIKV